MTDINQASAAAPEPVDSAAQPAAAEPTAAPAVPNTAAEPVLAARSAAAPGPSGAGESVFKPLEGDATPGAPRDLDMIMEIPVTLSVQLGQTRLTIRELLDLAKGSIVELDGLAGEPMDILINGYLIAHGEVVVVDEKYGIRITEIIDRAERIHKLNQ